MMKAIAIDDEIPALNIIANFCDRVNYLSLEKTFNKPGEALKYITKFPVDLLFLDINMPSLTGIEFYKAIEQDTMVIFTTAYSEYAVEGFTLKAIDYLLKPFTFERFQQATEKALEYYNFTHQQGVKFEEQFLFIRADYSLIKIKITDIIFIEGLDDYLKIHLVDNKPVVARMTMKGILQKLPSKEFIRVHRSFIVPFSRIENVRNKVIAVKGVQIPIGTRYEEEFLKYFPK